MREVFEFVEEDCDVDIEPPADRRPERRAAPALGRGRRRRARPEGRAAGTAAAAPGPRRCRSAAPPEPPPPTPPRRPAPPRPAPARRRRSPTIRVDLDRVDRLINLVGELVISQAMLGQRATESGAAGTPAVAAASTSCAA